ncbi:MAG: glycoside hydrolase family 65 protein [Bacteroidota bacterium]
MKNYIIHDEWNIIEDQFRPEYNRISESIFSIGNGRMGQRANFEESYSGDSLQGSYLAGIYYPDKTRVGWWKNGYPEYFAKVLNAPNWIGIKVEINGEQVDLSKGEVLSFERRLNMKEGFLERKFHLKLPSGKEIEVHSKRFCSIVLTEVGAIRYAVKSLNFSGNVKLTPYVDADVINEDSNYDEKFWNEVSQEATGQSAFVTVETKKLSFQACSGMLFSVEKNGALVESEVKSSTKSKYAESEMIVSVQKGDELVLFKYAANTTSENYAKDQLIDACTKAVRNAKEIGFDQLLEKQKLAWDHKWGESDIEIEGDVAAQQGIRFNIFQLNQTYTGEDERLNIGPKGFTGEKYGGSTYWDTEAYCLPFYLATADQKVARNLLIYRYRHLQKAIENAEKLGFGDGAALYPMVTMNGEECHNEWEITFEEIHRNGAIAYAIYDYVKYTGDEQYLSDYGLEVLIAISRFWSQRVNFSEDKQKYVMLGVTGPNEYENNVNNNWYTNTIAAWTLKYTSEVSELVKSQNFNKYESIVSKISFDENKELENWSKIVDQMYYPEDDKRGVFLQQDGFLDKELIRVDELDKKHLPINQNWSWDRILRSCFIKQADVLQGLYFFEEDFDQETIKRNFDFYEPITVHESSLSPCVHSIQASLLGYQEKAYEMYLRTARLDLDDYNNDTEDGCHTTSMAGTWLAVIKGFAGMRVKDGELVFKPFIPSKWKSYSFQISFRRAVITVHVRQENTEIKNISDHTTHVVVHGQKIEVGANDSVVVEHIIV